MKKNIIKVVEFTRSVQPLIDFLNKKFPEGLCISDIVDKPDISEDELLKHGVKNVSPRRYVDLVLEGGGVHGIALAGYTYVLEKMGNSFMNTAGTSAGAINCMLLQCVYSKREAVILKKNPEKYYETRSEKLLEYLCNKDLSEIVDGHQWWKNIILKAFTGTVRFSNIWKYIKKFARYLIVFIITLLALLLFSLFQHFLKCSDCLTYHISRWGIVCSGILLFAALCFMVTQIIRARMLYYFAEKMGINPGSDFEHWISECLADNGINNIHDLSAKLQEEAENLHYKYKKCASSHASIADLIEQNCSILKPIQPSVDLLDKITNPESSIKSIQKKIATTEPKHNTDKNPVDIARDLLVGFEERAEKNFISRLNPPEQKSGDAVFHATGKQIVIVAADITNEIKVEFPAMHAMYWGNDYSISPSQYVRASMSIPIFFKPFKVQFSSAQINNILKSWYNNTGIRKQFTDQNNYSLFVDGGLISNFPLNVFYNPEIPVPSKPTIGVKLEYEDAGAYNTIKSELGLVGSMLSTVRYFYDRDFLSKHTMYKKTVRSIDTGKINWLNFDLSIKEKTELFFRGALTAVIFLSRHKMTGTDEQKLLDLGKSVQSTEGEFSIYGAGENVFNTEDFSIDDITFEWERYKYERMFGDISITGKLKNKAALNNL